MALTYDSRFEQLLKERVEAERQRVRDEIADTPQTLEVYRDRVGYLRALREIEGWCSDANTDLNKG